MMPTNKQRIIVLLIGGGLIIIGILCAMEGIEKLEEANPNTGFDFYLGLSPAFLIFGGLLIFFSFGIVETEEEVRIRENERKAKQMREEQIRKKRHMQERLEEAEKLERSGRFEEAAIIYESLEMWEEAGRMRRKDKETYQKSVNINLSANFDSLVNEISKRGIVTVYKCPSCGGNINIDKNSRSTSLQYCQYCNNLIQANDLMGFLKDVLS